MHPMRVTDGQRPELLGPRAPAGGWASRGDQDVGSRNESEEGKDVGRGGAKGSLGSKHPTVIAFKT